MRVKSWHFCSHIVSRAEIHWLCFNLVDFIEEGSIVVIITVLVAVVRPIVVPGALRAGVLEAKLGLLSALTVLIIALIVATSALPSAIASVQT